MSDPGHEYARTQGLYTNCSAMTVGANIIIIIVITKKE